MDNLSELIQLYGLDNLPDNLRKERELQRWREIMAQQRKENDDAFIRHREAIANRWLSYYKKAKGLEKSIELARQYKMITRMRGSRSNG